MGEDTKVNAERVGGVTSEPRSVVKVLSLPVAKIPGHVPRLDPIVVKSPGGEPGKILEMGINFGCVQRGLASVAG